MAVRIRLARFGKKKKPSYRIVVTDSRRKRDGKYIEAIGYYQPGAPGKPIYVNLERYEYWRSVGAQPTEAVEIVVRRFLKSQSEGGGQHEGPGGDGDQGAGG